MANLILLKPSEESDISFLLKYDHHVSETILKRKIACGEQFTIKNGNTPCGFLRYSLFWDNTPFLNMFFLFDEFRNKGFGKLALASWERKMQLDGYEQVLVSTQANENAQHFFRSQGYSDCGILMLDTELSAELILVKKI